jgi:hypothetical protein
LKKNVFNFDPDEHGAGRKTYERIEITTVHPWVCCRQLLSTHATSPDQEMSATAFRLIRICTVCYSIKIHISKSSLKMLRLICETSYLRFAGRRTKTRISDSHHPSAGRKGEYTIIQGRAERRCDKAVTVNIVIIFISYIIIIYDLLVNICKKINTGTMN